MSGEEVRDRSTAPAGILHLSDLHLGIDPGDIGAPDKGSAFGFWKKRYLPMQSHDYYILHALRREVRAAARTVGAAPEGFDFYVVTGDISTEAEPAARFAFARDYLCGSVAAGACQVGLQLDPERVLCVPGNHDKMAHKTPDNYLSGFRHLPQPPPYVVDKQARNGRRFRFFGIDSNLYESLNIALGRISPATLNWLGERLDESRALIEEAPDAVRILLLHHHPADLNRFRRIWKRAWVRGRFSVLDEGDRLLDLCKDRIDVILHGHEHFPVAFSDETSGAVVVSAGTTSEWQGGEKRRNSFHTLVFEHETLQVRQFDWTGSRFEPGLETPFWLRSRRHGSHAGFVDWIRKAIGVRGAPEASEPG